MNLDFMLLIDKQFLDTPFYGVRQMTWHPQNEGHAVNEKRIRRLMRLMRLGRENSPPDCFLTSLLPIYQKPNTSRRMRFSFTAWPSFCRCHVICRTP